MLSLGLTNVRLATFAHLSSAVQVNEAFKDLSAIVDEQGHAIDQIEVNIVEAHNQTEKGVGHLTVSHGNVCLCVWCECVCVGGCVTKLIGSFSAIPLVDLATPEQALAHLAVCTTTARILTPRFVSMLPVRSKRPNTKRSTESGEFSAAVCGLIATRSCCYYRNIRSREPKG